MSEEFRETLGDLLKARFPILYIESHEEARVLAELVAVASDVSQVRTPRKLVRWSATEGLSPLGERGPQETCQITNALDQVMSATEPTLFAFLDVHAFLGAGGRQVDPAVVRKLRDIAAGFKVAPVPVTIVFVCPVLQLPPELEKDITIVDFPLPSEREIDRVLRDMIASNMSSGRITVDLAERDRELLVKAARGLTLSEAENAFARAMVNDGRLDGIDVNVVLQEKKQTIRKSGLLEYVTVDVALEDVGGLQNLKRWLAMRTGSWLEEAADYGVPSPRGVLITGVPGCGKSLTAKAVAAAWGLPLLRMDIGKIFSGLVGSSEQNIRTAIKTAEAIAPCVLWIDEIEKGFAGTSGQGDSGTSARVFGSFLTWMQEKTQPVFVIATANKIDALPPEFLRKGRFDEIFFVDLPTHAERVPIWQLHLRRRISRSPINSGFLVSESLVNELAGLSEGYSGAEIEQAVIAGLFDAYSAKRALSSDDLTRAVANMVPLRITQAEQIDAIRAWANVRAVAATSTADRKPGAVPVNAVSPSPSPETPSAEPGRGGRTVDF